MQNVIKLSAALHELVFRNFLPYVATAKNAKYSLVIFNRVFKVVEVQVHTKFNQAKCSGV